MLHDRSVRYWQQRLRLVRGHRAKSVALPACHHDGLQDVAAPCTSPLTCVRYNSAAHQYSAVPQMANAHPNTRTTSAVVPPCTPRKSSGNAYIRHQVAVLPTKLTSSAPYDVYCRRTSRASATDTSRAASTPNSHHGMIPRTASAPTAARM